MGVGEKRGQRTTREGTRGAQVGRRIQRQGGDKSDRKLGGSRGRRVGKSQSVTRGKGRVKKEVTRGEKRRQQGGKVVQERTCREGQKRKQNWWLGLG